MRYKKPTPELLVPAGARRIAGYLTCDTCIRTIPYFGYSDSDYEPWPQHRCKKRDIRTFDRFTTEEPYPPLPRGRWL